MKLLLWILIILLFVLLTPLVAQPNMKPNEDHLIIYNTIGLILAYADECYADSSETIGYYYPADEPFAKRKTLWLHRTPTFEGFIEYLRKRMR